MIDLHCHIRPGIDDEVSDIDEAVEMARIAVADGIKKIVATPHIGGQTLTEISGNGQLAEIIVAIFCKKKSLPNRSTGRFETLPPQWSNTIRSTAFTG